MASMLSRISLSVTGVSTGTDIFSLSSMNPVAAVREREDRDHSAGHRHGRDPRRRRLGQPDIADHKRMLVVTATEVQPEPGPDRAVDAVAPDHPVVSLGPGLAMLRHVHRDTGTVLGELGDLDTALDPRAAVQRPARQQAFGVGLRDDQHEREPAAQIGEAQGALAAVTEWRGLPSDPGLDQLVGDLAPAVEQVQCGRLQAERPGVRRCLCAFVDDRAVDSPCRQLGGQHETRRPGPDNEDRRFLRGHRKPPCQVAGELNRPTR
jgi:hypothetical protein